MQEIDQPGRFYLGRDYNIAAGAVGATPLLYQTENLTTHAVCVGMTGSGKTGLCLALLEEAAIDGIPVIAIDPKGDVGNLLLTFPELAAGDFRPWIEEAEAEREGITPDALAEQTAARWREGLAQWGQDGARIARFREAAETAIYTPGSSAGLPLSVLRSFDAPSQEIIEDAELLSDRIGGAVSGLLTLVGIQADPIQSREHILISQLLDASWRTGKNLDLAELVRQIQTPPLERVGSVDLETFYPTKARTELAMKLNNLLAAPSFAAWMEGEPLSIPSLLHTKDGKPRVSIVSIAHLSEAERMFFVTILLNELVSWVRTQSGTSSLRAILYMDEVFGYFPPTANPPSKKPMLTLLKQARAYGLGIVLATQNPVDLDYKGLSNTGTWFLGRLQTERDKARVLEGLEGASAAAGSTFNRSEMEATLAGLGKRVFLLNSVHEDQPTVFESRWCLSYLRGPLTRTQIQTLMADHRSQVKTAPSGSEPQPVETATPTANAASGTRPVVDSAIPQVFLGAAGAGTSYRPALLGKARLHFVDAKSGVDEQQDVIAIAPIGDKLSDHPWDGAEISPAPGPQTTDTPEAGVSFAALPSELTVPKNYTAWGKELAAHLYREHALKLWFAPNLKQYSKPGESEADFRVRVALSCRELRDAAVEKLKDKYADKSATLNDKVQRARERVAREKSEFQSQGVETAVSIGASILRAVFGRRWLSAGTARSAGTAARGASRTAKQHGDIARAETALQRALDERAKFEEQYISEETKISDQYRDPAIEPYALGPRKSDINVTRVALAWIC
jgi:hypothetical protein